MPDASITLLRFMELGKLLKSSRGSMPEFNQVADLSGSDKVLFFLYVKLSLFFRSMAKKGSFFERTYNKDFRKPNKEDVESTSGIVNLGGIKLRC